jgi:hypothetical protein
VWYEEGPVTTPTEEQVAEKQKRIRREKTKIRRLLKSVDKDRLAAAGRLIDAVAFMSVTLEDLQQAINQDGCVSRYQNGENQWGTKKSPEVEVYTNMMQRYLPAMKQLLDLLPDGPPAPPAGQPGPPGSRVRDYANRRPG